MIVGNVVDLIVDFGTKHLEVVLRALMDWVKVLVKVIVLDCLFSVRFDF